MSKFLLYFSAFVAGMTTLAIEMSSSRLLGNIYGTSDLVWAFVIAMVLGYITLGYYFGGRWADHSPQFSTFYGLLARSSLAVAVIPLAARPVLFNAAKALIHLDIPAVVAWVLVTAVIFTIPLILLGCVPPFIVRLAVDDVSRSGSIAGRVYGVSTLGSLLGAFGPVLVFIPSVGTPRTFLIFALAQAVIALVGLYTISRRRAAYHGWIPALLLILLVTGFGGTYKPPPPGTTLLYEKETPYNLVQVVQTGDGTRYLLLNEGLPVHSVYHPDYEATFTGGTWDYLLVGPYFNPPPYTVDRVKRIAIIGLAGGTIAQQYTYIYGPIPIDGIEIDPGIVDVGRTYFGMTASNLNAIIADGRVGLQHLGGDYSAILIDAYRVPYVPWHLTTVEFFEQVKSHLAKDGVLAINVGRTPDSRALIEAITATLLEVFPTVHVVDVPDSFNSILYATNQPTESTNLTANAALIPENVDPVLSRTIISASNNLQPAVASDVVFTDDRAPIEWIVHRLVLEYLFAGDYTVVGVPGDSGGE